ncbi:MAG TPA: efflux RND transporter periplasmic adaptor subunit [Rubrivivax sp.]|nr:efflux RND transporter periplasmic adaptor subunit [Burkholderiales bacterium]HNT40006.1 efflux RND transporter periplasmic adaptor subunit [Rubrivivax sp.]
MMLTQGRRRWLGLLVLTLALAGAVAAFGVRAPAVPVAAVRAAPLVQTVVVSARVASPTRVFLGSTLTGRVAAFAQREGARLAAGELVVQLEDAEWAAALQQADAALASARARLQGQRQLALPLAAQQLVQATANAAAAERERVRNQTLFDQGFIGQARLDEVARAAEVAQAQLRAAQAQEAASESGPELAQARLQVREAEAAREAAKVRLAQARVLAPGAALLLQRLVEPGQIVQPGTRLAELALQQPPQLVALVDEKFLGRLALGQSASVVADAYPQQAFEARIASIAPLVDAQRGSVEVKFALPAVPDFLRDDLTVSVEIVTARRERTLVIPAEALRAAGTVQVLEQGRVAQREVRTGVRGVSEVEVLQGLREGEWVVLGDDLRPGQRARPAPEAAAAQGRRVSGSDGIGGAMQAVGR